MSPDSKTPITISNLYSELFRQVLTAESERRAGHVDATIIKKNIRNKLYYYYQYYIAGSKKQVYLGTNSEVMRDFIREFQSNQTKLQPDLVLRRQIVDSIKAAHTHKFDEISAKLIKLFSDCGLFKVGAVLVGTYAFLSYAYMLGVNWTSSTQTQDIDISQDKSIGLALSEDVGRIKIPDVLEQAKLGFFPVPELNPKHPSTSFKIRGKEMHVDFLTPLLGKPNSKPIQLPTLNTAATPLR